MDAGRGNIIMGAERGGVVPQLNPDFGGTAAAWRGGHREGLASGDGFPLADEGSTYGGITADKAVIVLEE